MATLYLVSTPIGNLDDVSRRAAETLTSVDRILAEDTRRTRILADRVGAGAPLVSLHAHNEQERIAQILGWLDDGEALALVSDAGTPLVSDPGFKLVREAVAAGHAVIPVPGPSALLAGLVAAGLPSDRFLFLGFLPPKSAARKTALSAVSGVEATLIAYESGHRLAAMLADASETLGADRDAAVARELTKRFEETRRGALGTLAAHYAEAGGPKGEIVVLVGPPAAGSETAGSGDLDAYLLAALESLPVKAASEAAADVFGVPRRLAYQRALALRRDGDG